MTVFGNRNQALGHKKETHLSYGCPFFAFPLREHELLPLKNTKGGERRN